MTTTNEVRFERIRERAYELWDRNHRPEGLDIQFWVLAEQELRLALTDDIDTGGKPSVLDEGLVS